MVAMRDPAEAEEAAGKGKNDPETLQAKTLSLPRGSVNPLGGCLPR